MLLEVISFIFSPFLSLFDPYLARFTDALTSYKTQRVAVKTIFAGLVIIALIVTALIAYLCFYILYVPEIVHVKPVYLQYHTGSYPTSEVDFIEGGQYSQFLTAGQSYEVSIDLHVPASERNIGLGNFMISLALWSSATNDTVVMSSRPCILTYQSKLLRIFSTIWRLVPLLAGFTQEDQKLKVVMLENMIERSDAPITKAFIGVHNPELEVYNVQIRLDAHFKGLRFFMYYYSMPAAFFFMTLFLFWEIIFSVFAWRSLVIWWQSKMPADTEPVKIAPDSKDEGQDGETNGKDDDLGAWQKVRRSDAIEGGATTETDSEGEPSRPASVISPSVTRLASEAGETSYTESYNTEDDYDTQSMVSRTLDDEVSITETETEGDDDDADNHDGIDTPTYSRRGTMSGVSADVSETEEGPNFGITTSRALGNSSRVYPRRPDSRNNDNRGE